MIAIGAEPRGRDRRATTATSAYLGIFFGRAAINVDTWRAMADAIPGTSGSSLERDLLGAERPGQADTRAARPLPGRRASRRPASWRAHAGSIRDQR